MRPIDADAVKAVFEEKSSEAVCGVELCKAIISRIDEAPTIDAVPVIRCKDCQFYQTDKGGWCLDHDDDVLWLEDSYCSRAVRRKE